MKVRPGRRAWWNVRHPNLHLLAIEVAQGRLEQVRTLYRLLLLLRTHDLAAQDAYCDRCNQRRGSPDNRALMHGYPPLAFRPLANTELRQDRLLLNIRFRPDYPQPAQFVLL